MIDSGYRIENGHVQVPEKDWPIYQDVARENTSLRDAVAKLRAQRDRLRGGSFSAKSRMGGLLESLSPLLREHLAAAWDQGWEAGQADEFEAREGREREETRNPYRDAEDSQ